MKWEMENWDQDLRSVEHSHGKNVLNLVVVAAYLKKPLENARVVRYFLQHCIEILAEFQQIFETKTPGTG